MSEGAREPTEEELLEAQQREDAAASAGLLRLDFRGCGDDCPWFVDGRLQGFLWHRLTGEQTQAPDALALPVRLEVERAGGGGWLNVEPKDRWSPDQVSRSKLLARFGGGRLWRLSIRWKGDTLSGSTLRIDLTGEGEAHPAKPIPGDEPPLRPTSAAQPPAYGAPVPHPVAHDPASMLLGTIPAEHRGAVAFALASSEREMERQAAFYKATIDLVKATNAAQPMASGGSAELTRRLERDVDDARRERDSLRSENARLVNENFQLRQRLALVEAYGAHVGGTPSPAWDLVQRVLGAAAPEFARGLASRVDPNGLMRLAETAMSRLPADQLAGALAAAGGLPGGG